MLVLVNVLNSVALAGDSEGAQLVTALSSSGAMHCAAGRSGLCRWEIHLFFLVRLCGGQSVALALLQTCRKDRVIENPSQKAKL